MRTKNKPQLENRQAALGTLQSRGAHFVLLHPRREEAKARPVWARWNRRRPPLDLVLEHGPDLGVIPWSLGTTALDLDWGPLGELVQATDPLAILPTPRGVHLYYEDSEGRGNGRWTAFGAGGEIRGARGFVRLYDGGPALLADALGSDTRLRKPFPADLFEAAGVAGDVAGMPVEGPRVFRVKTPEGLLPLEHTYQGVRNSTLFDHLRLWAYAESKGLSLIVWKARVLEKAESMNRMMSDPLGTLQGDGQREVRDTAYSVSSWTWAGGGPIDHSPAAQRRRGVKSGRVRRRTTRERDGRIVSLALRGPHTSGDRGGPGRLANRRLLRAPAGRGAVRAWPWLGERSNWRLRCLATNLISAGVG